MERHFLEVPMDELVGQNVAKKCPECNSKDLGYEDGERFCKKCGYVFE